MSIQAFKPSSMRFAAQAAQAPRKYHIHAYYNERTRPEAQHLEEKIKRQFPRELAQGQVKAHHMQKPAGPHLGKNLDIHFDENALAPMLQLMFELGGKLKVLLHPVTGNELKDHQNPFWMGLASPKKLFNFEWFTQQR